jgi:aryl-alcohol dehydrogenase (NADP+)
MEAWERRGTERTWEIIDAVQRVAEARGISMAEVALSWLNERPAVTSVILGARTVEQLSQNLKADGQKLSADEVTALETASAPAVGDYPYGPGGTSQRTRPIKGGRATAG